MKAILILPILLTSLSLAQNPPARAERGNRGPQIDPNAPPETVPLWPNGAPGALGSTDDDQPTLTIFRTTAHRSNTAVVIAPGGGYSHLAMNNEGWQVAEWLNAMGVQAFVLKYRLGPRYHHPIELGDAQRAIRLVRSRAAEFGVSPDRIGMMGFSAGGHLTATAGTLYDDGNPGAPDPIDRLTSRPDFLILGYPVISFDPAIAHAGSVRMLVGDNPDQKLRDELSPELHVDAKTPPTFLFSTTADTTVPVENSVRFYLALKKAKVPAEMHIFENGAHGGGLWLSDPNLSLWPQLLANWMRGRGLLAK